MKILTLLPILAMLLVAGCAGQSAVETIRAASHARAVERMADNLSNKASMGTCSLIKTSSIWSADETTTVNCP